MGIKYYWKLSGRYNHYLNNLIFIDRCLFFFLVIFILSPFFVSKSILGWCGKSVLFTIALTYTAFIINQTTSKLRDLKLWVNSSDLGCLS